LLPVGLIVLLGIAGCKVGLGGDARSKAANQKFPMADAAVQQVRQTLILSGRAYTPNENRGTRASSNTHAARNRTFV
jgi:hypothetical protein